MAAEFSLRETYGKTLVELGKEMPQIVVLDADLSHSTMTMYFGKEFPDRFFNCGIAEQNMVSIAAGLAASGKVAFMSTFAVFAPGRCFDQLRISVAQPGYNVKVVSTHGGISVGEDGISHQAIEDIALICSLPGFTVIVPADANETSQVIRAAARTNGPFYIRLPRPKLPQVYPQDYQFTVGKAAMLKPGSNATIFATGIMVTSALVAAANLKAQGIDCRMYSVSTLKPIDEAAVLSAARETGAIVTAEEHLEHGGLGSTIARVLSTKCPVPLELVGIKDTYAQSGKPEQLLERYGLSPAAIEQAVKAVIQRKKAGTCLP